MFMAINNQIMRQSNGCKTSLAIYMAQIYFALASRKIYYCRPVRLGLWETFHNKVCMNDIPTRLVVTLSVRTLDYSHKICGDTYHNKLSELWPKTDFWGNTSCICVCGMAQLQMVEA